MNSNVQSGWLGPADPWPRHQRPEAQAALSEARAAGWWIKKGGASAHVFGRLRCADPGDGPTDPCVVAIYSTSGSKDGSGSARVIRDAVRSCPHGRPPQEGRQLAADEAADHAAEALQQLRRLVTAASAILESSDLEGQLDQAIDDALTQADVSVELGETVEDLDRRVRGARARALAMGLGTGIDPWPPDEGCQEVVRLAEGVRAEVQTFLLQGEGSDRCPQLAGELARLSERLKAVKSQVEAT